MNMLSCAARFRSLQQFEGQIQRDMVNPQFIDKKTERLGSDFIRENWPKLQIMRE